MYEIEGAEPTPTSDDSAFVRATFEELRGVLADVGERYSTTGPEGRVMRIPPGVEAAFDDCVAETVPLARDVACEADGSPTLGDLATVAGAPPPDGATERLSPRTLALGAASSQVTGPTLEADGVDDDAFLTAYRLVDAYVDGEERDRTTDEERADDGIVETLADGLRSVASRLGSEHDRSR